jgi:acetylornithine deacetylase/succinyl-diaminopimelate desuccinylase-like protein
MSNKSEGIHHQPAELLQNLIRFNTTNPPGNEADCMAYIKQLLSEAGFKVTAITQTEGRPNLITRLKGRGDAPPLMLYGHVDVVTTAHQEWIHPPFEAKIVDGYIWGRGALDMKGGISMMLSALLRAKEERLQPAGDIVFMALCDEEALGREGAEFLVKKRPDLFEGIRYALGEFGGVPMYISGKKFYPIQVAEKQACWMRVVLHGPAGHGSRPMRGGAMANLAELISALDRRRFPVHITPVVKEMFTTIAAHVAFPANILLRLLLRPSWTDRILKGLGAAGKNMEPLFHHTVNVTIVHGGEKINVIPSEIAVEMDGRLLPGFVPEDMFSEVKAVLGKEIDLELLYFDPAPSVLDMGWFEPLADILRQMDPQGIPIPMLLPAVTDGRFFSRLGIQTYGFTPMNLPEGFNFFDTIHAENERIPVEALSFGAEAMYRAIQRYGQS